MATAVRDRASDARDLLWPCNCAVGAQAGGQVLAVAIEQSWLLEEEHVVMELDIGNAFPTMSRKAMVMEVANAPVGNSVRDLAPVLLATLSPESIIVGLEGKSVEGLQTGEPSGPLAYCMALHPDLEWADAELAKHGGCLRGQMDDMYVRGPIRVVLPIVMELGERIKVRCGQTLKPVKCKIAGRDMDDVRAVLASEPEYAVFLGEDGDGGIACVEGADPRTVQWGEGVGVTVNGVPRGDAVYVNAVLSAETEKVRAQIDNIIPKLGPKSSQGLQCLGIYCYQTLFQHYEQLIHPAVLEPFVEVIDGALLALARAASGVDFASADEITLARFRMPRRMYGGCIRERLDVSPAAWLGGLLLTLPQMIDSEDAQGEVAKGFMPSLVAILGEGSFNAGREEERFEFLINSGSVLGGQFSAAWDGMRAEVAVDGDFPLTGVLSASSSAAGLLPGGEIVGRPQKAFTAQREECRFEALQGKINELAPLDERRQCFMNLSRTSTQFVGSAPVEEEVFQNVDWWQANQTYYGLESSQCRAYVGMNVKGRPLDAYGEVLMTARTCGDHHRKKHDIDKWNIDGWLEYAGVSHNTEVSGLFRAVIGQQGVFDGRPERTRNGLFPDFLIDWGPEYPDELCNVKCCQGKSYFDARSVEDRCGGVERRARRVPSEYRRKARKADREYNDWDAESNGPGPVESRLAGFGTVRALVFGPRGEVSKDVERLIRKAAEVGAERRWRLMGARSQQEARAALLFMMRRSIGITAVRANAKMMRERLGLVLGNGAAASKRRRCAKQKERNVDNNYWNWSCGDDRFCGSF